RVKENLATKTANCDALKKQLNDQLEKSQGGWQSTPKGIKGKAVQEAHVDETQKLIEHEEAKKFNEHIQKSDRPEKEKAEANNKVLESSKALQASSERRSAAENEFFTVVTTLEKKNYEINEIKRKENLDKK